MYSPDPPIHFLSVPRVRSGETLSRKSTTIWSESRFVLRAWSLSISTLAILLLISLADGQLAVIKISGNHTAVLGYWTNCQRHTCPHLGKVTVSKHIGMGFMILALATDTFCLLFMAISFRHIFRRINRCDLVFGILNYTTGVLIALSMLCFTYECWNLGLINFDYVLPYYLCWVSACIQFLSGCLCLFNHWYTFRIPPSTMMSPEAVMLHPIHWSTSRESDKSIRVGRRRTTFHFKPRPFET